MTLSKIFRNSLIGCTLFVMMCFILFVSILSNGRKKEGGAQHYVVQRAIQKREGSSKDIFLVKNNQERLHYRIESAVSFLKLVGEARKLKLVEEMSQIRCWMEESAIDRGVRQIRYFETEQGRYDFNKQQFDAGKILVSLYNMEGNSLCSLPKKEQIVLQGEAEDVFFSLSSQDPKLQAKHFKAHFSLIPKMLEKSGI